jgi:hypothetical protein
MEFVSRIQEVDRFEVTTEIWQLRGQPSGNGPQAISRAGLLRPNEESSLAGALILDNAGGGG